MKREFLQLRIKDVKKHTETQSEQLDPRTENNKLSALPNFVFPSIMVTLMCFTCVFPLPPSLFNSLLSGFLFSL